MFPHTITIFGKQRADKTYPKTVIKGVLWYGTDGMSVLGKGLQDNNSLNVVIPKKAFIENNLPADFLIEKSNKIVKGEVSDVEKSITELNAYRDVMTVNSVNDYDFGSNLDCILIGGN